MYCFTGELSKYKDVLNLFRMKYQNQSDYSKQICGKSHVSYIDVQYKFQDQKYVPQAFLWSNGQIIMIFTFPNQSGALDDKFIIDSHHV